MALGTSCGAVVRYMHDLLLVLVPSFLQARGAVALVTLALMATLPVAVVYVDIQVVALLLGDGGVRDRLGDSGQPGATLLGGEVRPDGAPRTCTAYLSGSGPARR